jgi:hypothetical protein
MEQDNTQPARDGLNFMKINWNPHWSCDLQGSSDGSDFQEMPFPFFMKLNVHLTQEQKEPMENLAGAKIPTGTVAVPCQAGEQRDHYACIFALFPLK